MELLKQGGFSSRDMDSALMSGLRGAAETVSRSQSELQFYRQWLDLIQKLAGKLCEVGGRCPIPTQALLLEVGQLMKRWPPSGEQVKFNTAAWGRTNGPWPVITLESKLALAQALHDHKRPRRAENCYREVVADSSEDNAILGTRRGSQQLFNIPHAAGRYPDAERVLLNAWDQVQRRTPPLPGAECGIRWHSTWRFL